MTTEEILPAAQDVADAFAAQYYAVLQNAPEQAHKVYSEDSVVSRSRPDGTMMSYKSIKAINNQILSCDNNGAEFEITTVDGLNSCENGVFVAVTGSVTRKNKAKLTFSQTFYLAKQQNAYVVLNDVLRYLDCEPTDAPAENKAVRTTEDPTVDPAEVISENAANIENNSITDHTSDRKAEDVEVVTNVDRASNGKVEIVEATDENTAKNANGFAEKIDQPDASTETQLLTEKKSFASMVKVPIYKPKNSAPKASTSFVASEKKIDESGTSIYVGNLPMTATHSQLHEIFCKFGPIRENGIQIRSSWDKSVRFGFVAFVNAKSAQESLQMAKTSPFTLADRKLRVNEKLSQNGSRSGPSGRKGGFQNRDQPADDKRGRQHRKI